MILSPIKSTIGFLTRSMIFVCPINDNYRVTIPAIQIACRNSGDLKVCPEKDDIPYRQEHYTIIVGLTTDWKPVLLYYMRDVSQNPF